MCGRSTGTSTDPGPVADLGEVFAGTPDVVVVLHPLVHHGLAYRRGPAGQPRYPVDDVDDEVVAVHVVEYQHVERSRRGALLLVPAHVDLVVVGAPVGQPVDEPRVPVVGEDDRLVGGEDGVELGVRQAVRVLGGRLQAHEVHDVDDAHLEVGQVVAEQVGGGEHLQRRYVAGGRQYHVGLAVVVAGPVPDAQSPRAVQCGVVHVQPGGRGLLAGDDDVDVVAAAQAVVGHGQQGVRVRWQVHPDHLGLLVHHVVDEAGILVGEAVVVLPPHVRGQQVVERRDRLAPGQVPGHLEPFGVLVDHRVDDVYERLVAGEQAVPAGQQVPLEPALAGVFGQDLHHPPGRREVLVHYGHFAAPDLVGDVEDGAEAVGLGLVGADDAEVARLRVGGDDVAQEAAEHPGGLDRLAGLHGIGAEVGHFQVARVAAAVGVRVGAHPRIAGR